MKYEGAEILKFLLCVERLNGRPKGRPFDGSTGIFCYYSTRGRGRGRGITSALAAIQFEAGVHHPGVGEAEVNHFGVGFRLICVLNFITGAATTIKHH
jgi:hypothetical protein